MTWYEPWTWFGGGGGLGSSDNPSNYNTGPNAGGFGGPGEIAGGGQVPLGSLNLPYFQQDRDRLQGYLNQGNPYMQAASAQGAQVGKDSYQGNWAGLINQLQNQASGNGPSLAMNAYRQASQDSMGQLSGMAAGSNAPGAARQAMLQQGRVGQGMAQGLATARTQEQLGAQGLLGNALTGAGNAQFQRDALNAQLAQGNNQFNANLQQGANQANQGAFLKMLGQQLGLSDSQLQALMADQNYTLGAANTPSVGERLLKILGTIGATAGGMP